MVSSMGLEQAKGEWDFGCVAVSVVMVERGVEVEMVVERAMEVEVLGRVGSKKASVVVVWRENSTWCQPLKWYARLVGQQQPLVGSLVGRPCRLRS
ncbi:hypothetical protein Hanom_Chr09g00759431 [Helianthus anomalus]